MSKYVIRGKNGYIFTSNQEETYDQEEIYGTYKQAEVALKQIRETLPFEEFEIITLSKDTKEDVL